ncbi:MAG: CRISPR/Cas system-associated protein Cas10, large subunit of type III CRISPR-Cas system [Chloroflexi bacterium AL-W]|nr:CRISPR/Cas system-associated protein Cas10, large subunit of type III CRISPR-Cas system [Chloroflexi bacterium AL-N1]NOK65537.1 CRISPR/Cas system-associated protein Cas10, large subunit of type III CRISPR-Cas system [Chloroflexi bacterium AL-N10]NOK74521.1 CRISPR/Cas system-associated protein Cas10, large subunit of type III CRISPR-Cas system [Chloroflexi bacterium AL-N5]NOK80570.1 CRISPR/Cas system-associated protein Cas10, large subunit of type III CRISPR-Cas system [Chloroflexi bacterium A
MDDTTKDSPLDPTKFNMTATLRGLNFGEDVIKAFERAQEWRKSKDNGWRWPSKSDDWFDILANHRIGLVYGGATKIKQYVFEAPKLPEIRGASAILDRINLVDLRLLWDQQGLTHQMIIYASGGSILGFAPGDQAEQLAQDIEQTYTRETLLANSVAVSRTFSLLEVLFGVNTHKYGLPEFKDDWKHPELRQNLEKYYYDPPRAHDIAEVTRRFINRKNFGELITLLATMANRRREGLGGSTDGNNLRRDIPHYPILPLAQKCQTSDIRAAIIRPPFDSTMLLSEASARKAYAGRFVKKTDTKRTNDFADDISWYYRGPHSAVSAAEEEIDNFPALQSWEERWEAWFKKSGANSPYAQMLKRQQIIEVAAAQDVDDIGATATSRANGYIGMIYADGDRVGQRIATLKTPDDFTTFSNQLSEAALKAVFIALGKHLKPHNKKNGSYIHPFEIITIGGDDLLLLVPGDKALEIATTIAYEFETGITDDKTTRQVGRYQGTIEPDFTSYTPNIGISAGVVIAPENTPIFFMQKLAEDLLKNAKKLSKTKQSGGAIDFMILKSITMVTDQLDTFRRKAYGVNPQPGKQMHAEFTARPFLWHELVGLLETVRELKQAHLPRSQLYRINEVVQDKNNSSPVFPSILEFLYTSVRQEPVVQNALQQLRERWRNGDNEQQNPAAPWLKNTRKTKEHRTTTYWETFWPDIVEIYDFVAQKEQSDA